MAIDVRGLAPLLGVCDMPTSIAFYRDVLGFQVISTSRPAPDFGWALRSLNGVELILNTAYDDGQSTATPDLVGVAAHRDTAIYFGCPEVDAAYAHPRMRNIPVKEPKVAYYGMKQVSVGDPDGYNLCFQWPATQAAADEWRAR
jgi:catechol 2,3-dioxygenase-like lactoylglutathione lyase family enzyme